MRQMNQSPLSEICAQMEGYLKLRIPKKTANFNQFLQRVSHNPGFAISGGSYSLYNIYNL